MTTDPPTVTTRVNPGEYGNRILEMSIRGVTYYDLSFSIGHFPEEKDEWLVGVLTRQITELTEKVHRNAQRELQKKMQKLLGVRND